MDGGGSLALSPGFGNPPERQDLNGPPQWGWVILSAGRTPRRWQCCLLYWRGCTHTPPTTTQEQGLQSLPIGALWVAPACSPCSCFALIWAGAWAPAISSQGRPQGLTPPSPTLPQPTLASVSPLSEMGTDVCITQKCELHALGTWPHD